MFSPVSMVTKSSFVNMQMSVLLRLLSPPKTLNCIPPMAGAKSDGIGVEARNTLQHSSPLN